MNENTNLCFFGPHISCKLNQVVLFAMCSFSALFQFLGGLKKLLFIVIAVRVLFLAVGL